jgi:hypothetical protein
MMSAISPGRVDLRSLVTHWFKLDEIEQAYELFGHQRDGVLKVAITPESLLGLGPALSLGARKGMAALARTPVLSKTTLVGPLSAQLRHTERDPQSPLNV